MTMEVSQWRDSHSADNYPVTCCAAFRPESLSGIPPTATLHKAQSWNRTMHALQACHMTISTVSRTTLTVSTEQPCNIHTNGGIKKKINDHNKFHNQIKVNNLVYICSDPWKRLPILFISILPPHRNSTFSLPSSPFHYHLGLTLALYVF